MTSTPIVLVTGSSIGGIGAALCEEYASRGYIVYASARRLESLEGFKHKGIRRLELDVTDDASCGDAVDRIIEAEGRIDVFVSNAGTLCIGAVVDVPVQQAKDVMDCNFFGTLRLARLIVPHMAKRHSGLIVTIGSIAGEVTTPWNAVYSASKAAQSSLAEGLAMECGPLGIKVLNVNPGAVKSNIAVNQARIFQLPPNSLWKAYADRIVARMHISQGRSSMPSSEFARRVVDVANRRPWFFGLLGGMPLHYRIGGMSKTIAVLLWLPRWLAIQLVWRWTGELRSPDV